MAALSAAFQRHGWSSLRFEALKRRPSVSVRGAGASPLAPRATGMGRDVAKRKSPRQWEVMFFQRVFAVSLGLQLYLLRFGVTGPGPWHPGPQSQLLRFGTTGAI